MLKSYLNRLGLNPKKHRPDNETIAINAFLLHKLARVALGEDALDTGHGMAVVR